MKINYLKKLTLLGMAFIGRGYSAFTEIAFTLLMVKFLGPHDAGMFFFVYSGLVIAITLGRAGPDIEIVRKTAVLLNRNNLKELKQKNVNILIRVVMQAGLVAVVLFFSLPKIAHSDWDEHLVVVASAIGALSVVPASISYLAAEALKGHGHTGTAHALYGGPIYTAGIAIAAVLMALKVSGTMMIGCLIVLASCLIGCAVSLWIWRARAADVWRQPVAEKAGISWGSGGGWSLVLIRPLSMAVIWAPNLMLGAFAGADEVSVYTVAMRSALALGLILFTLEGYVAPRMATYYADGKIQKLKKLMRTYSVLGSLLAFPVFLLLYVMTDEYLNYFFDGSIPSAGAVVMHILLLAQMANVAAGPVAAFLLMCHKERQIQLVQLIVLIVGIAAYWWRIPIDGVMGAAYGYGLVIILMKLGLWAVAYRLLHGEVEAEVAQAGVRSELRRVDGYHAPLSCDRRRRLYRCAYGAASGRSWRRGRGV